MKNMIFFSIIFILSVVSSSCGVIIGGSKYQGTIIAKDHPDAEIFVDGKKIGVGQAQLLVPRNKELAVTLKQEGCPDQTIVHNKSFRTGIFILSALTTGLIGVIIDTATGASYKPDHKDDKNITKLSEKNYEIQVEYSECKN